jgi:hypothetical protein
MTTVGGVGIGAAAILCLAWMLVVRADPYRGYGGVGRGGIVLAALCGGALPIFAPLAGTAWSLFGTVAQVAQTLADAASTFAGAGVLG